MRLIFVLPGVIIFRMYICICNAITERQVLASVEQGSATLADLQADLGVATCCGCCAETALEYLPGGRYAGAQVSLQSPGTLVGNAANDPVPAFQETVVRRA